MKGSTEKKKPKYNMGQCVGYMLSTGWRVVKSVIVLAILLAVVTAGQNVLELLIAPVILGQVERGVPLGQLLLSIGCFAGGLFLIKWLASYLDTLNIFPLVTCRGAIVFDINLKYMKTSYPNTLDTRFQELGEKARGAVSNNNAPGEYIWRRLLQLLINLLGFVVYLFLLSGLNPLLACMVIITTVISHLINKRITGWSYRHREEEEEYHKRLGYLKVTGSKRQLAKDIRIFGLKTWLDDLWASAYRLYLDFLARRERIYLWMDVTNMVLAFLRNGAAYAYLIWFTLKHGLPASEFLLYFNTISGFSQWVLGIMDQFTEIYKQCLEISAIREFLDWPESFRLEGGEALAPVPGKAYELKLENVSYRYPGAETDTISHMDLTLSPGEKLAIVGLNGAGKTTLVRLLCGLLDPTEGRVLLDGKDIRDFNRWDYYTLFSTIFQDFSVLDETVAVNVAQSCGEIDKNRVWTALEQAGMAKKVRGLPKGLDTIVGREIYEDGVEFSGGETQRLMLARALYKDAPVIILDEPTAALDPIAENEIYQKYSDMTQGRTSLFISHRLASTRFCDRILFLEKGKIAEEGTHDQLLAKSGGYARLFEVQSRYYQEGGREDGQE